MGRLFILLFAASLIFTGTACADPVTDRIYPAPQTPLTTEGLPSSRLITVRTRDGLELSGIATPGRADRPVLLVLHGNGSSARTATEWFAPLISAGYGVVAADYRGYSGNPGEPSEAGLAADADAFMAHARTLAGDRPVWIVGHSLGGGAAMALAERDRPDVLVTIGTFTRLRDMVSGLARAAVPDAYRNLDRAKTVSAPWYLVHGLADDVVPASHGQTLHSLAGAAGRTGASFPIVGAGHQPDGDAILAILEAIRTRAPGAPPSPAALPDAIKVIPFGQSTPLPAN
jgi:hypothetical protein